MTTREVAAALGVSVDTVTRWCRLGRLPATRFGRDWRIDATALQRPADPHPSALARTVDHLPPGAHALVLVLGGRRTARRVVRQLADAAPGCVVGAEPVREPGRGPLRRALAEADRHARTEVERRAVAAARRLVRWSQGGGAERMLAETVRHTGATVLCVAPLPEADDLPDLLAAHTHLLLTAGAGQVWSRPLRPGGG